MICRVFVTVMGHFGRTHHQLVLYGVMKPGGCSSVDWLGSGMLSGFKINCSPSQQKYACVCVHVFVNFSTG